MPEDQRPPQDELIADYDPWANYGAVPSGGDERLREEQKTAMSACATSKDSDERLR